MSHEEVSIGQGIQLSFGSSNIGQKAKRVRINEKEEKPVQQLLTGFSETGAVLIGETDDITVNGDVKRVIPTRGNDFRGMGPRAYNPHRFLPEKGDLPQAGQGEDHFQFAAPEESVPVQYGLNTMGQKKNKIKNLESGIKQENDADGNVGLGERVLGTGKDWETEAFKKDVANLPDTASLEEYAAMPVEAFGEAMLRGMGWSEDREVLKDQAKEFVRRAPLLGLGATQALQTNKPKRIIRPGESRNARKDLVVYDKDGNIKHTKTASDKLVERVVKGPAIGKRMRIISGRHAGLGCTVTVINDQAEGRSQTAAVKLKPSEETVTVRLKELGEWDDKATISRQPEQVRQHERKSRKAASLPGAGRERDVVEEHSGQIPGDRGQNGATDHSWLMPHIRIKIVDKRKGNGQLYLKKGEIIDVMSRTECRILLDDGRSIDAQQQDLETVIPKKEGARVLVVAGQYRGQRAKLLQRNTEFSQAAIQLTEDFSICKVSFDEIAEFVGEYGVDE